MPRIERSESSKLDAVEIWLYIALDNPSAADNFDQRIESRLQSLANMPLSGEMVPSLGSNIRRVTFGNYVIYYSPIEDLRILHGARETGRTALEFTTSSLRFGRVFSRFAS